VKHLLCIVLLAFLQLCLSAQSTFIVSGKVSFGEGKLLPDVAVTAPVSNRTVLTGKDGRYSISLSEEDSTLIFFHISFQLKTVTLSSKENTLLDILLEGKSFELKEITVSSEPEIVYGANSYDVSDYEFTGDHIVLLAANGKNNGSKLVLLNNNLKPLKNVSVPAMPGTLFRDCFGTVHILTENSALEVELENTNDTFRILFYEYPLSSFNYLRSFVGRIKNYYYSQEFGAGALSVSYYCYDTVRKDRQLFSSVADESRIRMAGDEGRRFRTLLDLQKAGMGSRGIATLIAQAESLAEVIYKNPVDAQFCTSGDSVYIFDFYNKFSEVYSPDGNFVRKMQANYGNYRTWTKKIIKDGVTEKLYTLFVNGGYNTLTQIGTADGKLMASMTLPLQYPKNIKIHNGYAYFIYRPFESLQTKYLYRVRID
jgi:hypothetical protein